MRLKVVREVETLQKIVLVERKVETTEAPILPEDLDQRTCLVHQAFFFAIPNRDHPWMSEVEIRSVEEVHIFFGTFALLPRLTFFKRSAQILDRRDFEAGNCPVAGYAVKNHDARLKERMSNHLLNLRLSAEKATLRILELAP